MYDQLRSELIGKLHNKINDSDLRKVLATLDNIVSNYNIDKKGTDLVPYNYENFERVYEYLQIIEFEGMSKGTVNNYRLTLTNFFSFCGSTIENVSANDIRNYLFTYQKQRNVSIDTLNKYRQAISSFFEWALGQGYCSRNPAKEIKQFKGPKNVRKPLTRIEVEYCRRACRDIREEAIFKTYLSTGARLSELINANQNDIDWDRKEISVMGKNKKPYKVYFSDEAKISLKLYLDSRNDDCPAIFVGKGAQRLGPTSVEKIIKNIGKRSGIAKNVTPHVLRHTMATMAFDNGAKLETIQRMLNHEQISTTLIYAEVSTETVRAAHEKYAV